MRKASISKKRAAPHRQKDAQVAAFHKQDLGAAIARSGAAVVVRSHPTSILLPEALIAKLKARAAKLGIGYQTLLKAIVTKHIDDDL